MRLRAPGACRRASPSPQALPALRACLAGPRTHLPLARAPHALCPPAQAPGLSPEDRKTLEIMRKTFLCYITEDPAARALKEKLNSLEAELSQARNNMALGYSVRGPRVKRWARRLAPGPVPLRKSG